MFSFRFNASNYLDDVIMLSGTFQVKILQQAVAALEDIIRRHFKSKQLICWLIKKLINNRFNLSIVLKVCSFSNAMASYNTFAQSCRKPD